MEGITCGSDSCANYIYVGDEYNYIYKLNLATSDPATAVEMQWDINSVVGDVSADKGIESLAYAPSTGYFYAGIQDTSTIHVLELTDAARLFTIGDDDSTPKAYSGYPVQVLLLSGAAGVALVMMVAFAVSRRSVAARPFVNGEDVEMLPDEALE